MSEQPDPYAGLDERQLAELARRFDHHPPDGPAVERHTRWRQAVKAVAAEAMRTLPPGRESALVLTALDEALMFGNAAIARPAMPGARPAGS